MNEASGTHEAVDRVLALHLPELDDTVGDVMPERSSSERSRIERSGDGSDDGSGADAEPRGRRWEHALEAIDAVVPGMESLRIGLCAARARGPARYYGGETAAAESLIAVAADLGYARAGAAVASGRFAAEQAACIGSAADDPAAPRVRVVPEALTADFLSPLPVRLATDPELAEVLAGLGILTLGAFAALPEEAVLERFGAAGSSAHRLARGLDPKHAPPPSAAPRRRFCMALDFEPPLDDAERLAFACRAHAEGFIDELAGYGLVCTELRIEFIDDRGARHERQWAHPSRFTDADVVNRIRWQAAGMHPHEIERSGSGIAEVRLTPVRIARAADHEPGLWSDAPNERIHHHLTRVQGLLGYRGVGTGELLGGRLSADRQGLVPWGAPTRGAAHARFRAGPWPGRLDGALPSTVFADPPRVRLLDREGRTVRIDHEELLGADPARLQCRGSDAFAVEAWSAPWPLRERWWADGEDASHSNALRTGARFRLQVLLESGEAWLLRCEQSTTDGPWGWVAEGRYD